MALLNSEWRVDGCYLGKSDPLNIINREIVIAAGSGVVYPGTILGRITASGKYAPHDPTLTNGVEQVANTAIMFNRVDATSVDKKAVATAVGGAEINGNMLTYKTGMTDSQKFAAREALRAKGLSVLPQHFGE